MDGAAASSSSRTHARWKKRPLHYRPSFSISLPTLTLILFFFIIIFFFFYHHHQTAKHLLSVSTAHLNPYPTFPKCSTAQALSSGERFLWYAPHSGFSNQLSELKNAILLAAILNRTLVVPPVLDHHAVALGSCPKFRVLEPSGLRMAVWGHIVDLIRTGRYLSMADIVDISALESTSSVRTIDFRSFVSFWCDLDLSISCFNESDDHNSTIEKLKKCGYLFSGLDGNSDRCLYALHEDCRSTVWTYGKDGEDGVMDSFQPDEQLKKKKKFSYVRRRRDVYWTLGPGSEAGLASVLAFGSIFTAPYKGSELYIDIHEAPNDGRIQNIIKKIEFLPFAPEIISMGKEFVQKGINAPFFCVQLRLLDGQFKNHRKDTFLGLRERLDSLKKNEPSPIPVFVMTDLPESNWTSSYLGDLKSDTHSFKLHILREKDELVIQTAKKLVAAGHRKSFGSVTINLDNRMNHCHAQSLPDVRLYLEEAICSCASLGFSGTAGSTIAESIELMRKFGVCADQSRTNF